MYYLSVSMQILQIDFCAYDIIWAGSCVSELSNEIYAKPFFS